MNNSIVFVSDNLALHNRFREVFLPLAVPMVCFANPQQALLELKDKEAPAVMLVSLVMKSIDGIRFSALFNECVTAFHPLPPIFLLCDALGEWKSLAPFGLEHLSNVIPVRAQNEAFLSTMVQQILHGQIYQAPKINLMVFDTSKDTQEAFQHMDASRDFLFWFGSAFGEVTTSLRDFVPHACLIPLAKEGLPHFSLIQELRELFPDIVMILFGAVVTLEAKTTWIASGATDVTETDSPRELLERVQVSLMHQNLVRQEIRFQEQQQEFKQVNDSFHSLFDQSSDAIWVAARNNGAIALANQAAEELTGLSQEELQKNSLYDLVHPDARNRFKRLQTLRQFHRWNHLPFQQQDKGVRITECQSLPLDEHSVFLIAHDITDLLAAQNAMSEQKERLTNILEGTNAGTWDWDIPEGTVTLNERWAKIIGYRLEELLPTTIQTWEQSVHPHDLGAAQAQLAAHFRGELPYFDVEFRQKHKAGHWVWINARGKVVAHGDQGQPLRMSGTHLDISEQKHMQTALQNANARLRAMLEALPDLLFRFSEDAVFLDGHANDPSSLMVPLADFIGQTVDKVLPPELASLTRLKLKQALAEQKIQTYAYDLVIQGETKHFEACMVPIGLGEAQVIVRDVTQRRNTQDELILLKAAIDQADEIVLITDTKGIIRYVNRAFEKTTGFRREDALGQKPSLLRSGRHSLTYYQQLWHTVLDGKIWQGRLVNRKKDGTLYTEDAIISPVLNEQGEVTYLVAVKRDITESLRVKEHLAQSQKVESIGRLAGGLAHDLNNMLTPVLGYSELLLSELATQPTHQSMVHQIQNAGQRAKHLVAKLLAFSRKQTLEKDAVDLNALIRHFQPLLAHSLTPSHYLDFQFQEPLPPILADASQIEQVLLNLVVNAGDAMPNGGSIRIKTEFRRIEETDLASLPPVNPGDFCLLSVEDHGEGMSEGVLTHIFEPFFSTKGKGGTGLGLATVFGIVKQHNGHLWVNTQVGKGTQFDVLFPCSPTSMPEALPTDDPTLEKAKASETLLVVDDDEQILQLCQKILNRLGYQTLIAHSGGEALRLMGEIGHSIHLILTDVMLGDIDGLTLAHQLSQSFPKLKMLFMSGYTPEHMAKQGLLTGDLQFLKKPFKVRDLSKRLRLLLDAPDLPGKTH